MSGLFEVALTSDESGGQMNTCMWDINTGTMLSTFKGGISNPRTLCMINQDYLISANKKEPFIQVWSLSQMDPFHAKMICPGVVTCLAVCPDGVYCAAGIGEKLHIWQVCSGDLLVVNSYHYQPIACLKFTDDGSHLISAGKDGLVLVWDLSSLLSISSLLRSSSQPRHVWSHHSLEVTDIHIGYGGIKARVATCSLDRTCKLYDLTSGELLLTHIMDFSLTSLTMDTAEYFLFLGAMNGNIYQINLYSSINDREIHPEHGDGKEMFSGHSQKITCLSVSLDGQLLFSGSHDNSARVWHIQSKQCIRVLNHRGPVTNALLVRMPSDDKSKLLLPIAPFKRGLYGTGGEEENKEKRSVEVHTQSHKLSKLQSENNYASPFFNIQKSINTDTSEESISEINKLRAINHQLYVYSIFSIINSGK